MTGLRLCVCHAATSLTKKDIDKRRHHCTSSREALLIIEASRCDEKDLSLGILIR